MLNTDNRLMSGTTLTDEYRPRREAARLFASTSSREIAINGFASAFLPWEDRERLHRIRARGYRGIEQRPLTPTPFGTTAAKRAADAVRDRLGGATPDAAIVPGLRPR